MAALSEVTFASGWQAASCLRRNWVDICYGALNRPSSLIGTSRSVTG